MSRIIATAAIKGAYKEVAEAERMLGEAMESAGATAAVEFPNTGYYLPIIYALSGMKVEKVEDMAKALDLAKDLLPRYRGRGTGFPTWGTPWMPG